MRIIGGSCWKRSLSGRFGPARNSTTNRAELHTAEQALKYVANHCIMNWIKPLLLASLLVDTILEKRLSWVESCLGQTFQAFGVVRNERIEYRHSGIWEPRERA